MKSLNGVGVALVTPFDSKGKIDFQGLKKLLHHTSIVDFWVLNGTTAESPTISLDEKREILKCVIDEKIKNPDWINKQLIFGIGGNNTNAVLQEFSLLNLESVDAILSVTPYYNKPPQKGLIQHYKKIADASPKPIILYNVPGRTLVSLEIETILALAQHNNIIGIKEADDDIKKMKELSNVLPENFLLFSGSDCLTYDFMKNGAHGVISVLANAIPSIFVDIVNYAIRREWSSSRDAQEKILPLDAYMYVEGNPTGIKSLLKEIGICSKKVRLPLVPSSKSLEKNIIENYYSLLEK